MVGTPPSAVDGQRLGREGSLVAHADVERPAVGGAGEGAAGPAGVEWRDEGELASVLGDLSQLGAAIDHHQRIDQRSEVGIVHQGPGAELREGSELPPLAGGGIHIDADVGAGVDVIARDGRELITAHLAIEERPKAELILLAFLHGVGQRVAMVGEGRRRTGAGSETPDGTPGGIDVAVVHARCEGNKRPAAHQRDRERRVARVLETVGPSVLQHLVQALVRQRLLQRSGGHPASPASSGPASPASPERSSISCVGCTALTRDAHLADDGAVGVGRAGIEVLAVRVWKDLAGAQRDAGPDCSRKGAPHWAASGLEAAVGHTPQRIPATSAVAPTMTAPCAT